jgi:hypothetical protein
MYFRYILSKSLCKRNKCVPFFITYTKMDYKKLNVQKIFLKKNLKTRMKYRWIFSSFWVEKAISRYKIKDRNHKKGLIPSIP